MYLLAAITLGKILTIAAWIVGLVIAVPVLIAVIPMLYMMFLWLWVGFLWQLERWGISTWPQLIGCIFVAMVTIFTIAGMIAVFI